MWRAPKGTTEDQFEAIVVALNFEEDHKEEWPEYVKARLVVDRALMDGRNLALFDRLVSDREFEIESDNAGIVVAHRVARGPRIDPESFGLGP